VGAADPGAGARWLEPATLSRIGDLELLARTVVEGFVAGLHRSPFLGLSVDFAEHRPYMPGDDIRKVDWRVYARTDRFYVKQYEAETNADVVFALDASRSMDYGSAGVTKLDYARYLTACLAHLAGGQRDRVGAAVYSRGLDEFVAPSVRHRRRMLAALDRAGSDEGDPGHGPGGTAGPTHDPVLAFDQLAGNLGRRGIVVVASDLYAGPERIVEAVGRLKNRGQDVIVFHVLDPAEVDFPFEQPRSFEDLETGERIPLAPEDVREEYLSRIEGHVAEVARRLLEQQVDHELVVTSTPLDAALFNYLSRRARRLKGRY
jgi:uncharacterized protein (DUF58 family)